MFPVSVSYLFYLSHVPDPLLRMRMTDPSTSGRGCIVKKGVNIMTLPKSPVMSPSRGSKRR
jgi:hypothetical protein